MGLIITIGIVIILVLIGSLFFKDSVEQDEFDDITNPDNPMYAERQEELFDDIQD